MFIDLDNRGTGKTTSLIHDAYFTGLPIVVSTQERKNYILEQAKAMGVEVKVFTVNEISAEGMRVREVLVDELEDILTQCLGCKVVKATMTRRF